MAGEIQLNSTTLATESSGSITAQLDTIRPNATNGSLTLQGDSSDAGVTGLTIDSSGNATFAQTISGGTIGSSVVFPAGPTGTDGGHALWIKQAVLTATTDSSSVNTAGTFYATGNTITISDIGDASSILVQFTHNIFHQGAYVVFRIRRTVSSTTTTLMQMYDTFGTGAVNSNFFRTVVSPSFLDTSLGSGSHTYFLEYSFGTSNTSIYYNAYAGSSDNKNNVIAIGFK